MVFKNLRIVNNVKVQNHQEIVVSGSWVVEALSEVLENKTQLDLALKSLKGGVAVWADDFECMHLSPYLRERLVLSQDDLPPDLGLTDHTDGGPEVIRRTYITDRGLCYLDTTLQKIVNKNGDLLGFISVCQDVTAQFEPSQFRERLMNILKCSHNNSTLEEACRVIYQCVELLGFRELTLMTYHADKKHVKLVARLDKHVFEKLDMNLRSEHPSLNETTEHWVSSRQFSPVLFNDDHVSGRWSRPYACVPILSGENFLGALVLSRTQAHTLTPELLHHGGRLTSFLTELSSVFQAIFHDKPEDEFQKKRLLMREKLEVMNFNQKQIQIIEMLSRGETNKGIASAVNLSEQGVKYHVGNLLERFGSRNRLELRTKLYELIKTEESAS